MTVSARMIVARAMPASYGHEKVDALAGVGVHRGEDRRVLLDAEEVLIERDLRCVLRIRLLKPVAIEPAPALRVDRFMFPQTRIGDVAGSSVRRRRCRRRDRTACRQAP